MKKLSLCSILIYVLIINIWAQPQNEFINNSEITGKVMEFMENMRFIRGDFKIQNPQYILTAGQGKIDSAKNIMEAYINVKLVEKKYTMTCNKLIYFIGEEKAVATGNPKIIERPNKDSGEVSLKKSIIKGNRITNFINEDRIVVEDNVTVEKSKFVNGKEELDYNLFCDNLTYYDKTGKAIAIGNVRIERADSDAYGDRLIFYEGENRIEIVGNASIKRANGDRVYGEKILYFTEEDRVLIFKAKAEMVPGGGE